jgi:hypothetical protein
VGDTLNHEEEILSFFVGVVLVQLIQVDDYESMICWEADGRPHFYICVLSVSRIRERH